MPALVMNALDDENQVTVGGNIFTFKPRQIKFFYQDDIAATLTRLKGDMGFIGLPIEMEDLEYRASEEGKKIIEAKRKDGVEAYCRRLRELVYNAQVSLKQDLERSNIKADPKVFASDGDVDNMERLVKYQSKKEDTDQKRVDKLKELEKQLSKG